MTQQESSPGEGARLAFAFALAQSLLQLELAVVRLAATHDIASQLLVPTTTMSLRSRQTKQVLPRCLQEAKAARESIQQAEDAIELFLPPPELFGPASMTNERSVQEGAAARLLRAYTFFDVHANELVHLLQEQADDFGLWEHLDQIPAEIRAVLTEVHGVFSEQRLLEHLLITRDGIDQLGAGFVAVFGDTSNAGHINSVNLKSSCTSLLRPLVQQITGSAGDRMK